MAARTWISTASRRSCAVASSRPPGLDVPGVVDDAIDLIAIVQALDQPGRGALVGQIGLDELTRERVGDGAGDSDHVVTLCDQFFGGGQTDPPAGAGDDDRPWLADRGVGSGPEPPPEGQSSPRR